MATYTDVLTLINTKLANGSNITAIEHREVEQALLDFTEGQWLTGDVKEIDCDDAYILANFETNGLGKNERTGWAICNGQNGTRNRTGRVSVAYGTTPQGSGASAFILMGSTSSPILGGSKDAVVVAHTHALSQGLLSPKVVPNSTTVQYQNGNTYNSPLQSNYNTGAASSEVSGTDKNMQPYIVTLFIQKL